MSELLPCPFCGKTPEAPIDATRFLGCWRIVHRGCVLPNFSIERAERQETIEQWNTRADAALAEIGAVRVKPLAWVKELPSANPSYSPSWASTPFGSYYASEHAFWLEGNEAEKRQGREAAKAAAQADYEARILAAIEPAPSVREAARVLLDLLGTKTEDAPVSAETIDAAWQATFRESGFSAVRGFLRAIAEGKE